MSLFETVVFSNIVEVISSDNYCPLHFHLDYSSSQYTTSDRYVSCEWTLLVNVFTLDGLTRDLEAETNISGIPELLLRYLLLQL